MTVSALAIAVEGIGFSSSYVATLGFFSADAPVTISIVLAGGRAEERRGSVVRSAPASTAFILWRNRPATVIRATSRPATIVRASSRQATRIHVRLPILPLHVNDVSYVDFLVRDGHTNELLDPSLVSFKVATPSGVETTYVLATDAEMTRSAVGTYRAAIPCTAAGRWDFAILCTGPIGIGVEPGYFDVVATN